MVTAGIFVFGCFIQFLVLTSPVLSQNPPMDYCPPEDPNCHPSCIKYDVNKCRVCLCNKKPSVLSTLMSSASSTLSQYSSNNEETEVTSEGVWQNWLGDSDSKNKEHIKYVIVEKPSASQLLPGRNPSGYPNALGNSPFQTPSGPSPFQMQGGPLPPGPGGGMASGLGGPPDPYPSVPDGYHVINVPTSSRPGVPAFCVKNNLLCPQHCHKVDMHGCHSCPCAPASRQFVPVLIPDGGSDDKKESECLGTLLCMMKCNNGYHLGDVGSDGCPVCTCIKQEPTTTTPAPTSDCTERAIACMLRCAQDDKDYKIEKSSDSSCPSCHCEDKKGKEDNNNNNNKNTTGTMDIWNTNQFNNNNNNNNNFNSGNMQNNFLQNPQQGTGSGDCQPPMCLSGGGSGGSMTSSSSGMSEMPTECKPPLSYANCKGLGPSVSSISGGSSSGGSSSECAGPFCANKAGKGSGSSGVSNNNSGMGMAPSGTASSTVGGGSTGSSCTGPFCAAGSGMGGSMASGGGASTGGMQGSPFMAALGGGGPSKLGGMMGGAGSPFGAAMGPHGPMTPGRLPTEVDVGKVAGNQDCFGPSCSVKGSLPLDRAGLVGGTCPDLLDCVLKCDTPVVEEADTGCPECFCP